MTRKPRLQKLLPLRHEELNSMYNQPTSSWSSNDTRKSAYAIA